MARPLADVAVALAIASILFLPMLLGRGAYINDWENHLFLVAKQASYVRQHLVPTYFLNTIELGWFYPWYAFYGGTLYYLVAVASLLLGSAWAAYVGSYLLAAAAAMGGWTWLARQAGIPRWYAYLPGLVFVCGAYYLTNAYGRGAYGEFTAVSTLPLVLAASWHLVTCRRIEVPGFLAVLIPVAVMTGSHTITLLYGSVFLGASFAVLLVIFRPSTARPSRLAALAGIAALGLGANAWFLFPLISYRETLRYSPTIGLAFPEFTKVANVFSLFPRLPFAEFDLAPQLYVQPPLIPIAAAALIIALSPALDRRPRILALTAAVAVAFLTVLLFMTDTLGNLSWWDRLPKMLQVIQFPYRLGSYLLMCAAGLMLVACHHALHARRRRPRLGYTLVGLLTLATVVQVGFALHQAWTAQTYGPTTRVLENLDHLPKSWYDNNYFNNSVPKLQPTSPGRPMIKLPAQSYDVSSLELSYSKVRGGEVKTNVVPSPLIEFIPPGLVGQFEDYAVLRAPRSDDTVHYLVRAARTPATAIGPLLTLLCLATIAGLLGYLGRRCSDEAAGTRLG